jgi:hypothetical protein
MATMAREGWTDQRLDDLNHRVSEGFGEMRDESRAMRGEMGEEFRALRGEMAANQRTLVQMAGGIWVTSLVGFLGVIATVITQG